MEAKELNHRILSREEEVELVKRVEKDDEEARNQLIEHNLRLVVRWATEFHKTRPDVPVDDYIGEGNLALVEFIDRIGQADNGYNWRLGNRFATYFRSFFWRRMLVFLFKNRCMIKTPYGKEVASIEGLDWSQFNKLFSQEPDPAVKVADEEEFQNHWRIVKMTISAMSEREVDILSRRFGINGYPKQKLKAIALKHKITKQRVKQIIDSCLDLIRAGFSTQLQEM